MQLHECYNNTKNFSAQEVFNKIDKSCKMMVFADRPMICTHHSESAGPVIQANGWLTFEDDLRSGGLLCFTQRF